MAGMVHKGIDQSKITTDQQYTGGAYNPSMATGENFASAIYNYFDASFGASFNMSFGENERNSLFFGAGYHHVNRPQNSFYRSSAAALNPKYVISGGVKYVLDDNTFFTLQGDFSRQGKFTETIGGALYSVKIGDPEAPEYILHGGAFLRWKDALIPVLKIDYHPFAVAISYDVNVSQLKTASQSRGGFELSVSYIGFLDRNNSSRDKVLCPRF